MTTFHRDRRCGAAATWTHGSLRCGRGSACADRRSTRLWAKTHRRCWHDDALSWASSTWTHRSTRTARSRRPTGSWQTTRRHSCARLLRHKDRLNLGLEVGRNRQVALAENGVGLHLRFLLSDRLLHQLFVIVIDFIFHIKANSYHESFVRDRNTHST